jgi:hypothetical protein
MNKLIMIFFLFVTLNTFGQSATEIAKTGINSTVSIVALDQISQPLGYGSGFIIDDELIATNVHVIEGSNSAYILKNGEEKKYTVSGYVAIDKANDLVILKVSGVYGTKLPLGSETLAEIGEKIYAVGNPKGLKGTFSEGIISGIRNIETNQVLQITAPISPGSSGGPVLNSSGQVIGIAFASFTEGQNLNFAIPVKYLLNLKTKVSTITSLSTVKSQPKPTNSAQISPNIKEGVILRNIASCSDDGYRSWVSFSIKNNLPYTISDVRILFLLYDNTGTVIDYDESTFFNNGVYYSSIKEGIKPFLAKTFERHMGKIEANWEAGYKFKLRILDFKIHEND